MEVALENIRQAEGITEDILPLKELMERRFNLSRQVSGGKQLVFTMNKIMRICLIASLGLSEKRDIDALKTYSCLKPVCVLCPAFSLKTTTNHCFQRC